MIRIAAIIVTYNRRDKLLRCIDAALRQTADVQLDIIVVDNNSGNKDDKKYPASLYALSRTGNSRIHYYNMGLNIGGAGGFCFGIRKAAESGYDYIWLLDDDCIPADDALEEFLRFDVVHSGGYGFLSGKVLYTDGSLCEMNVQRETLTRDLKDFDSGPRRVVMASFVSLFIPVSIVKEAGLPFRQFFIWTDDWEYTRRISRRHPCWMVPSSTAVHDRDSNTGADIAAAPDDNVDRFRYLYRNDVYLYKREGVRGLAYEAARLCVHSARIAVSRRSFSEKRRRLAVMLRGTAEGFSFFPEPERALVPDRAMIPEIAMTPGRAQMTDDASHLEQSKIQDRAHIPKKLKILEAFGEPISFGGQETFVMNVLENMDMSDFEADLLSPYYCDNSRIEEKIGMLGGEVYALGCSFRPGGLRNGAAAPVREFLREHSYDLIHIHSGSNSMLAMLARLAAEEGIPRIIVHSHCTGKHGPKHIAAKTFTAYALKKYPSEYCACSPEAADWRFPRSICKNQLLIINNGIDTEKFRYDVDVRTAIRKELGIDDDTVLAGCVGRLTPQKNQSFLLDVMDTLRTYRKASITPDNKAAVRPESQAGSRKYKLILIGDGEDRQMLESKASSLGLADDVIFTGSVDNVQDYLQAMDVAVMPSRYEGLAIAVIEEQAAGLEILASDRIPISAAVTGGVTFLPAGDTNKWVRALTKEHARHPEQTDQVAESGYSIKETAETVRRLYKIGQVHTE